MRRAVGFTKSYFQLALVALSGVELSDSVIDVLASRSPAIRAQTPASSEQPQLSENLRTAGGESTQDPTRNPDALAGGHEGQARMAGYDVCPTEVQQLLVPWLKSVADGDNRILRNIRKRMWG